MPGWMKHKLESRLSGGILSVPKTEHWGNGVGDLPSKCLSRAPPAEAKAMPKNAHTTTQLHSSHTLEKEYSKFSKPGFNNM